MRTERKSQDGVLGGESPRSFRRRFDSVADGVPEAAKAALEKQEAVLNQKCVTMLSGSAMKKQEEDDESQDWFGAESETQDWMGAESDDEEAPERARTGLEPVCEDAPHPRYQPGIYEARCIAAVVYRDPRFRRYIARLKLQLVPDGRIVCAFRNLGSGEKPVVKRGSEYRRDWIIANGEQPRKRQTLSPRVFINKIFRVRIDDVKKRHDGREHPDAEVYSTVKEIIARLWP